MKRSELNQIMREGVAFFEENNFNLPPFAYWSPEEWEQKGHECDEIRDNMLGWDVTDFGLGDFYSTGLLIFTLRNGNYHKEEYKKPYAEKVLIAEEEQVTPFHFHWDKMEDFINRAGGNLIVELYDSTEEGELADTEFEVSVDGERRTLEPGAHVRLTPGESITIPPYLYHKFWAEKGHGKTMIGEVSKVNDDTSDNRFLRQDEIGRFPELEEDEDPLYLLCNEYPSAS